MWIRGETERRQSWSTETHTSLSSHHPPQHPLFLLSPPVKTNVLLGSSKFSGVSVSFAGCSTLASSQMPPANVYFYKCCMYRAGDREEGEPESFTKALWHSAPEIISAWSCPGQSALSDFLSPLQAEAIAVFIYSHELHTVPSQSLLSWKASSGLQHPSSPITGMFSCLI